MYYNVFSSIYKTIKQFLNLKIKGALSLKCNVLVYSRKKTFYNKNQMLVNIMNNSYYPAAP